VVIWRSLLNAPPLADLLHNWLQTLARQTLSTFPETLDEQVRLLLTYLRQERCLLVLDNMESLFATAEAPGRAGVMRTGYEGYDQLLQRIAGSDHQSTLLLTSREQPYALQRLGRQAQVTTGQIQILSVTGLDQAAGQQLLQSNGLLTSAQEAATLIENYSGNPLALQIAAATIADFFGGDVAAFRREEAGLFDGIQLVLDQQFARLTALERDTLIWLAIERQEATPASLRSNFVYPVPVNTLLEALLALQSRSLVETRSGTLTLPNVIIEYTTDYFVEQIYQELIGDALTLWQGQGQGQGQGHRQTAAANQLSLGAFEHPLAHSFLNRFPFFKAQAKEYVRQSQQRFILQPLADRLLANVGKPQLLTTVQQLLRILRQATSSRTSSLASSLPGYAAGNLLNLLLYLEVDLAAYDFSELQIRQAHLRNKNAAGLRLIGAQLRDPTFSDNFSTILAMAFHATDELLATGVHDGTIYLWQTKDWQRAGLLHGHTNAVRSLAFAPSATTAAAQSLLASGGGDGRICLWHLEDGQNSPTYTLQREGYVRALAFSHDGTVLVSGSDDQLVSFWQVATGELRRQCRGHQGRIYGISSCAPLSSGPHQGRALVFSAGEDAHIYVWEANSGEQVAILAGHQHSIHALACVSIPGDGAHDTQKAWLASADASGLICLWNLQTFSLHYHWHEDRTVIHTLSFNATGTLLASAGDNGLVHIWELGEGRLEKTIQAHPRAVVAAIFSARSPFLLATCGYDHLIRLWNSANGQALQVLHGFRNKSYVAQFQPSANNLLATGHTDGIVRLWQVDNATPRLQRQLMGHRSNVFTLAFSPDGTRLASGSSDATIRLWNSATGEHLHTLYGHTRDIFSVAFSPDGEFLVSTSADQTIRLWETAGGCEVRCFADKGCSSWSAVFHPSGKWVASGDFDYQVRLWEVATGQ
ncbi:MAG: hypothetical protein KDE19_08825, partial [Caldilineaceae bacterium]|nr:hypothetical protein [Caldilineaceae bacterium]